MDVTIIVEPTDNVETKEQVLDAMVEHVKLDICATCDMRVEPTVTLDIIVAVENIIAEPISVDI
jgi:hypothetical protein